MNLRNFEITVETKICDRGFRYYENKAVTEIEQVEKGEFTATVEGSEEYTVFIKLDEQQFVVNHSCDCPYDWGNVCKHEVEVMYYIKNDQLYNQPLEEGTFHKIKTDLAQLSKKELIAIIINLSKKNRLAKEDLLFELGHS